MYCFLSGLPASQLAKMQAPARPFTGCPGDHHAESLLIPGLIEDAVLHHISQFQC